MNEMKKMKRVLLIVIGVIVFVPVAMYAKYLKGEKIIEGVNAIFGNDKINLVYIGSRNCGHCENFNPVIESASKEYDFEYYYIDIMNLTDGQFDRLMKKFSIDPSSFGTPYISVIEKGKKVNEKKGYVEREDLLVFLQENKMVSEDIKIERSDDALTIINVDKYFELLKSNVNTVIVYASSSCPACIYAKPIINEVAKETGAVINYLELDKIEDEEKYKALIKSIEDLNIDVEEFGTPTLIIVNDSKKIDIQIGALTKEEYVKVFKQHNIIK